MDSWDSPEAFSDVAEVTAFNTSPDAHQGKDKPEPVNQTNKRLFKLVSFVMARPKVTDKLEINAFQLLFVDVETGEEAKSYFPIDHFTKEKKGSGRDLAFINSDSYLARLHRLATGRFNINRYRKANGIPKDLLGLIFEASKVAYAQHGKHSQKSDKEMYLKISCKHIVPVNIHQSESWTNTGMLIGRGAGKPKKRNKSGTQTEQKRNENGTQNNPQNPINTLPRASNEPEVRVLRERGLIEPHTASINSHVHNPINQEENQYMIKNNMNGFDFTQMPDESEDDFFNRVIEATF